MVTRVKCYLWKVVTSILADSEPSFYVDIHLRGLTNTIIFDCRKEEWLKEEQSWSRVKETHLPNDELEKFEKKQLKKIKTPDLTVSIF